MSDALSIGATIGYTDSFDKKVLPDMVVDSTGAMSAGQDVNVYGGINIGYSF